ncbi:DNA polymerase III subunit alpha (plasmid) [Streptomyces sp. RLB1-9]|uniref:DNA polymerase III subunit alpha n=1 Tax=Streptomyces sp. RLB1-9 TaxID=2594454 RepID=UPI0011658040|nr:DNA polymerase III subunit alpha [Streptomyces sp. RLB1-9]QDN94889.1 DNA polymerase III subunit alpha [Streptomyces sp. RLB1-9]
MLRLITSYAHERFPGGTHRVGGLNIHLPALVEHEDDGTRWLLVPAVPPIIVTPQTWRRALNGGAAGVMEALQDGVTAVPAHMIEEQDIDGGRLCLAYSRNAIFGDNEGIPTYHEVLDQLEAKQDPPRAGSGFVHLHTHSEYSPLDGLSRMDEIVREVTSHGQDAVAITDHGTCAGHPELQRAADKAGVKPIFGIEANLCDDRHLRRVEDEDVPEDSPMRKVFDDKGNPVPFRRQILNNYWHLCLFAMDNTGLRNIWAASTESYRDGFYGRPRMDWDTLSRFNEGVIASTGCLRGPVAVALKNGDVELAAARLTRLMDLFPGRLYVELQPNDMPDQVRLNQILVEFARQFRLPLLATVDSHFPTKGDAHSHDVWIACQTNKDVQDEGDLFAEDLNLYVMGEAEVRAGLAYLGEDVVEEAIANTTALAERCNARIEGETAMPSFTGDPAEDERRLRELCQNNWDRLPMNQTGFKVPTSLQQEYLDRFRREMDLLVTKGFCGYYLMVADYVGWAKDHGILVGPGRGSGGGSLVAYLARITSLDPVKHDLLFERFLTMGRAGLPDFDVDFPASKKAEILGYLRERWGERNVVSIGSELRLKNKAVINELVRALASSLPENAAADLRQVSALIDEAEAGTAGLGMSWEDLWIQHGEQLQPFADRYPELFAMAERLVGRLKSYGRHAAGVVISTGAPLTDWLPMRTIDGEEQMVTQWAMNDVEAIGLVKFDILTLRTLDTIQETLDLVREQRRYEIDLEAWEVEFEDPLVWDELQAAHTLGVFQIETHSGTRLCERMRPKNVAELADMVTIVRPGPMNSGLTDLYLRRRAGEQAVSYPDPRLEQVLAPTYGAMIYQEQVMAVTQLLAGYDESEADGVRRILGKKKVSAIADAGQEFLSRVDMPREQAERLWSQMAEFSKYGFNKSHAYAYAFLAFWTAFLKVNYPREFLVAAMSTVDKDRVPEFVKEARRLDVEVLPPDINTSGPGFTADPELYAVRYGLGSVKGVGDVAVKALVETQPYASWDDFEERRSPKANAGVVALLARIGAFDTLVPNRRGLEAKLLAVKTGEDARCFYKDDGLRTSLELLHPDAPEVCGFDWHAEPARVNQRTGKILKRKAPAKRCTKACRQYVPRQPLQIESVEPYSPVDIRTIEHEMLGTYLSSTPFDDLDPGDRAVCRAQAEQLAAGPNGTYYVAAIVAGARPHKTGDMGFLTLETELSTLRVAVFRDAWAVEQRRFVKGALCLAELRKNDRGLSLVAYQPL